MSPVSFSNALNGTSPRDDLMEQLIGGIIRCIPYVFYWVAGIGAFIALYLNAVGGIHTLDRNIKKARGKKWTMEPPAGGALTVEGEEQFAVAY